MCDEIEVISFKFPFSLQLLKTSLPSTAAATKKEKKLRNVGKRHKVKVVFPPKS